MRRVTMQLHTAPSFRLDGKRALVAGAGRGIGLAAASALADSGAHVTLLSRTANEIEEAAAAIRARGQQADTLVLDVTDLAGDAGRDRRSRAVQHPDQQCRHQPAEAADGRHHRGLRRDHGAERARRLFRRAGGGAAADRREASRLDHQHLVADGPCRRGAKRTVYCASQARDGRLHQGDGDRAWRRTTSG